VIFPVLINCFILVGNKLDREESRVVQRNDGQCYADAKGVKFFETSAMNGENVDLVDTFLGFSRLIDAFRSFQA
jgi:hypothetical protein